MSLMTNSERDKLVRDIMLEATSKNKDFQNALSMGAKVNME